MQGMQKGCIDEFRMIGSSGRSLQRRKKNGVGMAGHLISLKVRLPGASLVGSSLACSLLVTIISLNFLVVKLTVVMENLEPSFTGTSNSECAANPGIPVKRKAVYPELVNDPPSAKRTHTEHYSNLGFCCVVPDCSNRSGEFSFHRFPASEESLDRGDKKGSRRTFHHYVEHAGVLSALLCFVK